MEKFEISVTQNNSNHHFEVLDYMHYEGEQCKFEVYRNGQFIASFEPGHKKILHVCKDTGLVPELLLHLIAEELERYNI